MKQTVATIRGISTRDESRWRELWDGYNRFYGREPSEPLTCHAWARIMDPESPVHAIVAVDETGFVIGIANYIIHENTTQLKPVCYLQDLFVDVQQRGGGVGQQLAADRLADREYEDSGMVSALLEYERNELPGTLSL
jgi:hypothetical protein